MKNNNKYPVAERNEQLLNMFLNLGYDAKLIGDPNQPKIIIDNTFAVSGFVKNRIYNFTTKPFGGEVIENINLYETHKISRADIDELIDNSEKRKIWLCQAKGMGTTYFSHTKEGHIYTTATNPRVFFNYEDAVSLSEHLIGRYNFETRVVCPLDFE